MTTNTKAIRSWKDEEYRLSLSSSERAMLPAHPAGLIELGDGELEGAAGGLTARVLTFGCCGPPRSGIVCSYEALTFGCCPIPDLGGNL